MSHVAWYDSAVAVGGSFAVKCVVRPDLFKSVPSSPPEGTHFARPDNNNDT